MDVNPNIRVQIARKHSIFDVFMMYNIILCNEHSYVTEKGTEEENMWIKNMTKEHMLKIFLNTSQIATILTVVKNSEWLIARESLTRP